MRWETHTEEEIIFKIEEIRVYHFSIRRAYRYISEEDIGSKELSSKVIMIKNSYSSLLKFDKEIDSDTRSEINGMGHFLNQNILIRLYALIEYYGFTKPIDNKKEGYRDVEILKKLRDKFAHSRGKYNSTKNKDVKLLMELIDRFGINKMDLVEGEFPLPKDKVINTIFNSCKLYVRGFYG